MDLLFVAGEADVVGCDGVQEEPIKAGQVSVHLRNTHTNQIHTCSPYARQQCASVFVCVTMEKGWLLASSLMLVNGDSKIRASGGLPENKKREYQRGLGGISYRRGKLKPDCYWMFESL